MAVVREIAVTYGSYIVGTSSGSIGPTGAMRISKGFDRGFIEFSFYVTGATAAIFAQDCVDTETAFRKPYQDLTVELDGEDLFLAEQSTGGALDPVPEITKGSGEGEGDSGRARRYTVRIEFGLPATTGAEAVNGLREASVDVAYDPARRATVTISGTFTAIGTTTARAAYNAAIGGYASSVLSALGISEYELAEEPSTRHDVNNKTLEFTRVYDELIFSQAGASLNDSGIVRQRLVIGRGRSGEGDTPSASRAVTMDLSYEAWVDKTVTTNLRSKYSSIRSWLITQLGTTLSGADFAITEENPEYHYDENRITVRMTAIGVADAQSVIEQRVTVGDDDASGIEIVPAWSGDNLAAYYYPGPRVVVRTVTHTMRSLGLFNEQTALSITAPYVGQAASRPPAGAGGGGWLIIRQQPQATQLRLGLDSDTMDLTEFTVITQMRYVKQPQIGQVSPGGSGVVTPRATG